MPQLEIGGVAISFHDAGQGSAILLVHGLGCRGEVWINQLPVLAAHHRVIAVDLRGFGQSAKPAAPGSYKLDRFADDLIGLIEALGIAPVHYVGTSLGGYIGQVIALRRPDLLRSLALCHTASVSSIPARVRQSRLRALADKSMMHYAHLVAGQALAAHIRPAVHEWFCEMLAENDRAAYRQVFEEALGRFDLRKQVGAIRLPTLVLIGELDRVIPPAGGRQTARLIPGARVVAIRGVGHASYVEQPQAFNDAVLGFIDGVERGGAARPWRGRSYRGNGDGRAAAGRRPA